MQIPYMKVAIYALTFLGYAYTGYGANVLTSLRDAIMAAETIFGDFFKNSITLVKKFKSVHEVFDAAVEENCIFSCPNGGRPSKNKFHTPSPNGCGSLGMNINSEYLPAVEMEKCCDEHDICYDTCLSDKELCDLDFKRCLYKYCDNYEKSIAGDIVVKGCKAASKMLFTGSLTLGCKSYLDAQQNACFCPVGPGGGSPNSNGKYQSGKSSDSNANNKKYDKRQQTKEKEKAPNYGWKAGNNEL